MAELADHGPSWRMGGRSGHGPGYRWNAAASWHRRLQMDFHSAGAGNGYWYSTWPRAYDRSAAADGAESCVWGALRDAGWDCGILSALAASFTFHDGRALLGSYSWRLDLYWQPDGSRQTAGGLASAPAHLQGAEFRQFSAAGICRGPGGVAGAASGDQTVVSHDGAHCLDIWCAAGDSDWWRGHAHRDLAGELVRRTFRRSDGLCAQ